MVASGIQSSDVSLVKATIGKKNNSVPVGCGTGFLEGCLARPGPKHCAGAGGGHGHRCAYVPSIRPDGTNTHGQW